MTRPRKKPAAAGDTDLVHAALAELEIAPENAHPRADAHVARLAASIKAHGLLQQLNGYRGDDGIIYVTAGGYRLLALRKLRANASIPVRLEPRESATATGLAENVIRAEMPTGARVRRWKRLHAEGHSAEQIMKAFSIERRLYDRTMRLADLPDPILDALDAGEMTLDHAAAFTAGSPDEALALFEEVREAQVPFELQIGPGSVRAIRDRLTREKVRGDSALATFVGREAYEKRGGVVSEDLFREEIWFEDRKLLHDLAQSKLARTAKKLKGEWSWVETSVAYPGHEEMRSFGRVEPEYEDGLTEDEGAELDALIEKAEAGPDQLTEADRSRLDELEDRPAREVWTDAQRQVAGAIVTVDWRGEAAVIGGLVKPEDVERAFVMGVMESGSHAPDPAAVRKQATDDGAWKQAVIDDCLELRLWALRSELAADPEKLTYLLAADLAGRFARTFDYNFEVRSRDRLVEQGLTVHPTLEGDSDEPELAQVLALPRADVDAMLTRTLALRLIDTGGFAVAALPPDVRAWWTPNKAFLKRLSKPQLDQVVADIGARELASWSGLKKGDAVELLARFFAGDTSAGIYPDSEVTAQAIEAARAWLPPCLRPRETAAAEPEPETEEA